VLFDIVYVWMVMWCDMLDQHAILCFCAFMFLCCVMYGCCCIVNKSLASLTSMALQCTVLYILTSSISYGLF
jgi:hypothetical protein